MADENSENQGQGLGDKSGSKEPPKIDLAALSGMSLADLLSDDELKKDPSIADFKGIDGVVKSFISTKKMTGDPKSFVRLINEKSTDEEKAAFYTALGRPEKPDAYQLAKIKDEEKAALDPKLVSGFKELGHKEGLSARQLSAVYEWYVNSQVQGVTQLEEANRVAAVQAEAKLKQEWGADFDIKLNRAQQLARKIGGDEFVDWAIQRGIANDPMMLTFVGKLVDRFAGDGDLKDGDKGGGLFTPRMTASQAMAEVAKLQADPTFAKQWVDKSEPGHAAAIARMQELMELAYPR